MKPKFRHWIDRLTLPLTLVLTVVGPLLKLRDVINQGGAVLLAIAATVCAVLYAAFLWKQREASRIVGSTQQSYIYPLWLRIAALVVIPVPAAIAITANVYSSKQEPKPFPALRIPIKVYNGITTSPILIPPEAEVHILHPSTPAVDTLVASLRTRLYMPNVNRMNGSYEVTPGESAAGYVELPANFDYRPHMDRGLSIRLVIAPIPTIKMLVGEAIFDSNTTSTPIELAYLP